MVPIPTSYYIYSLTVHGPCKICRVQMYIWQVNVLRAQFDDEELATMGKLYWKIEYGDGGESSQGRTKEFTPSSRAKPTWNYFTEIRDNKATSTLQFSLYSKADLGRELGKFAIDLAVLRRKPDKDQEDWYTIQDASGTANVGKLHVEITYKSFIVDAQEGDGPCIDTCIGPGDTCKVM